MLAIQRALVRHGLDEVVWRAHLLRPLAWVRKILPRRGPTQPRGERLRLALEELGPIFVKFGQALSTRRDLLPPDIADELAKLQDQVPPFPGALARAVARARVRPPRRRGVRAVRRDAAGGRVDRAGARGDAARTARKSSSRCCGRASRR